MDDTILPGTGETVRSLDKSGKKTQVMAVDLGGAGEEKLLNSDNPMPTNDDTVGSLLRRMIALLMSPRGYDKSMARQRVTAAIENLPTLTTCTTVGTVGTITNMGAGRDAGQMLINPTNRTSWALNHRSRIT